MSIFKRRSIQMERFEDRLNDFNFWEPTQMVDQKAFVRLLLGMMKLLKKAYL